MNSQGRRLIELETRMNQDVDAWRRFATDLAEIKRDGLWQKKHSGRDYESFDHYCMDRWQIGSRDAAKKIAAGRVALKLDPTSRIFTNANQVHAFAKANKTTTPMLAKEVHAMTAPELEEARDQAERQFTDPVKDAHRRWTELHDRSLGLTDRLRKATAKYRHGRQIGLLCDKIEEFIGREEFSADRAA